MTNKRRWITTSIPLFFVVATFAVTLTYYAMLLARHERESFAALEISAEKAATYFSDALREQLSVLQTGAEVVSEDYTPERAMSALRIAFSVDGFGFFAADCEGSFKQMGFLSEKPTEKKYYTDAVGGNTSITAAADGLILTVSVKSGERVVGVLGRLVPTETLKKHLNPLPFEGKGYALVSDSAGDILIHSGGELSSGSNAINLLKKSRFNKGSFSEMFADVQKGASGTASYFVNNRTHYTAYYPLGIDDYMLFAVIDSSVISDKILIEAFGTFVLAGAIMLFGILLSLWLLTRIRRAKKNFENAEHLYRYIPCGIVQYTYDAEPKILTVNETALRMLELPLDSDFTGKSANDLHGGNEDYSRHFMLCKESKRRINYIQGFESKKGETLYYEYMLELIVTPNGTRIYQEAFIEVTARERQKKKIEEQYIAELGKNSTKDRSLLYFACLNLTQNIVVNANLTLVRNNPEKTADEIIQMAIDELVSVESGEWVSDYRRQVNRESLIKSYKNGKFEFKIKHRLKFGDSLLWVSTEYNIRQNPNTGDMLLFLYIKDINDEEIVNVVTRQISVTDYEFFLLIDTVSEKYKSYALSVKNGGMYESEGDYNAITNTLRLKRSMSEDDALRLSNELSLINVKERLSSAERYTVYSGMQSPLGYRVDKAMTFFYTDRKNGQLVMTVADVTAVRREEIERAEQIKDALSAAEVASQAKGAFLSQMSHEIRTPLNAIIGYLSLAKDSEGDYPAVMECVNKSAIASRHLLSIINDVLDISSIESGKLKIAREDFDLKHLIKSITALFYNQAVDKGLSFNVTLENLTCERLIGDSLRVNQILMNLLSNALKFTETGSVSLKIVQLGVITDKAQLRFTVSDTGCGMSDEYMKRLFTPFEQQDATVARKHGGSGLGLSITKNLVTSMGGQIEAESREGSGTTFTVNLAFDIAERQNGDGEECDFSRLRALVADDSEQDRNYIKSLLKHCGVGCDTVSGGAEAVKQVQRRLASSHPYDLCIIDWDMPDLDGIEAGRRIRELAESLPLICVTAYDAASLRPRAKKAGINDVIAKPLFQSTLFNLLVNTFGGYTRKNPDTEETVDIRGVRVLLAEDNDMNTDIAVRYLSHAGVETVTVRNGKAAVDSFLSAPPHSFDTILMDIQMPEMDGYTAAKIIRQSNAEDAKTVPIIAMTANAFTEDITAAMAAGMNDHIGKPIDFDRLYRTLFKLAVPLMNERTKGKNE